MKPARRVAAVVQVAVIVARGRTVAVAVVVVTRARRLARPISFRPIRQRNRRIETLNHFYEVQMPLRIITRHKSVCRQMVLRSLKLQRAGQNLRHPPSARLTLDSRSIKARRTRKCGFCLVGQGLACGSLTMPWSSTFPVNRTSRPSKRCLRVVAPRKRTREVMCFGCAWLA